MTDNQSSNNQDSTTHPRLQNYQNTGYSRQKDDTKNTEYRSSFPHQQDGNYSSRYQQQQRQQQQHPQQQKNEQNQYERRGPGSFQQYRDYRGGQHRSTNPTQYQQQQQMTSRSPSHNQWRTGSTQQNNYTGKSQPIPSPCKEKDTTTDDSDLVKNMQALSTDDTSPKTTASLNEMDDDNTVLECTATPLKLDELQVIIEKYEVMRGGCRIQKIDDTKALVVFGHSSTAKRAWIENKSNNKIKIQSYQGPMEIIEDIPIVRKSTLNQRPRPTNMAAKRLIHGSLGLKAPTKTGTQRKTDQDAQVGQRHSTPKR